LFKTYYQLTKPGIIYGNALVAIAGFMMATKGHIHFWLLLSMLAGTSLVIASACVFNNYIDRGIDEKMAPTKKRALVTGSVSGVSAMVYAVILGLLGFIILVLYTNLLTAAIGLTGMFFYVVVYGAAKRKTIHGTLVGSISGALPPVAGYTAVTNRLDTGALLLFIILVCWQMPHFYGIAMYRFKDYKAAGVPVWPVIKGMPSTKLQILLYATAFTIAAVMFTVFDYEGYSFLIVMVLVGLYWLYRGIRGFKATDDKLWGRKMFLLSLVIILVLSIMLSVGPLLP
jgi:protoheme IX farnesyltransferase